MVQLFDKAILSSWIRQFVAFQMRKQGYLDGYLLVIRTFSKPELEQVKKDIIFIIVCKCAYAILNPSSILLLKSE